MLTKEFLEQKRFEANKLRRDALIARDFPDYERGYWNGYQHAIEDALQAMAEGSPPPGLSASGG
jgi:hypothetical protein